jgi:hypothetical protein
MDFEQVHFKRSSRFDETFRLYVLLLVSIIKIDAELNFWFFVILKIKYKVAINFINYYNII